MTMQANETSNNRTEYNYVVGYANDGLGVTVMDPQRTTRLRIDYSRPVTLARCAEIMTAARQLSGRDLLKISLRRSIYSKTPGNDDGGETCYLDKRYDYDARTNSLLIYDQDHPVYANDNGHICRDDAAICDTLYE